MERDQLLILLLVRNRDSTDDEVHAIILTLKSVHMFLKSHKIPFSILKILRRSVNLFFLEFKAIIVLTRNTRER